MPRRTEVEQLHKIFKLCGTPSEDYWRKSKLPLASIFKPQQPYKRIIAETFKDLPLPVVNLIETLLSFNPIDRGSAALALQSEFFTTKPLPIDPSSSPVYPPRKELDVKLRDEEARRLQVAATTRHRSGAYPEMKITKETQSVLAPDANVELMQVTCFDGATDVVKWKSNKIIVICQAHLCMKNSRSKIEAQPESSNRTRLFNSQGIHVEQPTHPQGLEASDLAPLAHKAAQRKAGKNTSCLRLAKC